MTERAVWVREDADGAPQQSALWASRVNVNAERKLLGHRVARYVPESAWIISPTEPPPVDTFVWIIWNGVIQHQPWQWVDPDVDEGEAWFFFEGHTLGLDEIDAYLPIAFPSPPTLEKDAK